MPTEYSAPSLARGQRILAAIMVTDAVGFSARMSVDEGQTLQLIDQDLNLIARLCQKYEGTVLKTTGDGLLTYFFSAVQAVTCALEIQTQLTAPSESRASIPPLEHRIGIHLGDIVVSTNDVMGNGVNIAARLQTYAKPRGLCISQVIYDVIKARLDLNTTYLGHLKLKNIHEPVSAFQIDLSPADELEAADGFIESNTQVVTVTPDALLETTIQGLDLNPQSLRIKKLLFALAKNTWENDPNVLAQFGLKQLLLPIRQRYPTLPELRGQLTRIVAGLNRKTTYAALADIITIQLEPWYQTFPALDASESVEETAILSGWGETISALEHISNPVRMRKLLFCMVQNTWENDIRVLTAYPLERLLEEICQTTPTLKDLKYQLGRIIKRLNHKREYTQIANEIIAALRPLYSNNGEAPQLETADRHQGEDSAPAATRMEVLRTEQADTTTLDTSLSNPAADSNSVMPVEASTLATKSNSCTEPASRDDLYNLRLEIMRYANPLRTKILLYSCLHGPFSFNHQDWFTLKKQTLEELLRAIFDYCPSFDDLDSKLNIISHCLDNAEENAQVASIIARAMKPYYLESKMENSSLKAAQAQSTASSALSL